MIAGFPQKSAGKWGQSEILGTENRILGSERAFGSKNLTLTPFFRQLPERGGPRATRPIQSRMRVSRAWAFT